MIDRVLLNRIRKCLALSSSSNEHEAAAALATARRLMDENGLSDADLALAEVEESVARGSGAQRPAKWQSYLVATVRRALGVQAFLDEDNNWRFVGRGPSAEIAGYAFASLFRRLKAARAAYGKSQLRRCSLARKRVRADAFCEGWAVAVHAKVAALSPERGADEAVANYLTAQYPGLTPIPPRKPAAAQRRVEQDFGRGHVAGEIVDLHHGVGGGANTMPALAHG